MLLVGFMVQMKMCRPSHFERKLKTSYSHMLTSLASMIRAHSSFVIMHCSDWHLQSIGGCNWAVV